MTFYCIKCSKFTIKIYIKIKFEIDGKIVFILIVLTVVLKSLKLLMKGST